MITVKKKNINALLMTLLYFRKDLEGRDYQAGGLLTEKMGLGAKRKMQKIRKELLEHDETLKGELAEVLKEFEGKENEESKKQLDTELNRLYDEEIKLLSDPVMMSEIEKIETENNYDFDLIEIITEKH